MRLAVVNQVDEQRPSKLGYSDLKSPGEGWDPYMSFDAADHRLAIIGPRTMPPRPHRTPIKPLDVLIARKTTRNMVHEDKHMKQAIPSRDQFEQKS